MADKSYSPKVYKTNGGDKEVIASGGIVDFETGAALKFNGVDVTAPLAAIGAGLGGVVALEAVFTEDAASLTHTATFVIPAGATLLDIYVVPVVLWANTGGNVTFTCGDANSANGWFTATNLKATDLLLGERLQASQAVATDGSYGGTKEGAYLTTAGRFGQQSTTMIGGYCPTAYSVIGVVTCVAPASTAGRTRMTVLYSMGTAVVPVLA